MTEQTTTNPDAVIGTSGNDQITASTDVRAGDGNDSVQINPTYGNTQVITAEGESGHDTLTSESNSAVHLKGGEGNSRETSAPCAIHCNKARHVFKQFGGVITRIRHVAVPLMSQRI